MKQKFFFALCLLILSCLPYTVHAQDRVITEIRNNWKMHRFGNNLWYNATVPGCVHTDLIANKLIPDPFYRDNEKKVQWIDKYSWEYATDFEVSGEVSGRQNIELNFKGLDTYADVYLNDSLVLSADNMFIDWHVNVKKWIRTRSNHLRIQFHSPIVMGLLHRDKWNIEAPMGFNLDFGPGIGGSAVPNDCPPVGPYTRKAEYMYGWDWAPSLATSGIWRPVYLEAWNDFRIKSTELIQKEISPKKANLTLQVEVEANSEQEAQLDILYSSGSVNKQISPLKVHLKPGLNTIPADFTIDNPRIWWPNGMGEHPIYTFNAILTGSKGETDQIVTKTGLRKVRLVTEPDQYGTSFYFEINGVPVFATGADCVPMDIFPSRTTDEHYRTLIKSAADAHINMLRVWGGGIYESDLFYDLCDEYGIMIWQDFAFAITMLPNDPEFMNCIRQEAADNITRLRNHPSIVLWCGNNETEMIWDYMVKRFFGLKTEDSGNDALTNLLKLIPVTPVKKETTDKILQAYDDLFYKLLPEEVKAYDHNGRPYRSSSPSGGWKQPANANSGDMHYYIAYAGAPFEAYYTSHSRFYSEHGFQSFPDFNTVKKFTSAEDWNYLSPIMQHHQRAMGGNQVLDKYMKMYYRYPKDFENYLYVSQVMQADVMKIAFETHRHSRPYTMGTLYWQLNDVWPVASWSSMDYLNHWKALHYQVKRSFANVLVEPEYYRDTLKVYLVSDSLKGFKANAEVRILNFSGKELKKISVPVNMEANASKLLLEKTKNELLSGIDTASSLCVVNLVQGKKILSTNICYFAAAKNQNLPRVNISRKITPSATGYIIELQSNAFARDVYLSIDQEGFFSDNYFNLLPGKKKTIQFIPKEKIDDFGQGLKVVSLVDSY